MIFTIEELEDYNVEQLRLLAKYFNAPINEKMSKGRLIEHIYRRMEELDRQERNIDTSPASVRIQRIRNGIKEK